MSNFKVNSTAERVYNDMDEARAAEIADELISKDNKADEPKLPCEYEAQEQIIGVMFNEANFLAKAKTLIEPNHFEDVGLQLISRILFEFLDKGLPVNKIMVNNEIKERMKGTELAPLYKGQLNSSLANYVPFTAEYWIEKLITFYKSNQMKLATMRMIDDMKRNGPDSAREVFINQTEAIARANLSGADQIGWDELKDRANKSPVQWIVGGIIGTKEVQMVTSLPWGGKSTLMAEAIADVCQGHNFLEYPTCPCPILYFNSDRNPDDLFLGRITPHVANEDAMRKWFRTVKIENLPMVLTISYIEAQIKQLRHSLRYDGPIWIIIDTMRTAFYGALESGGENDNTTMVQVLSPLRAMVGRNNTAATLLHHNNKSTDDYAGAASIAGQVDAFLKCAREMESTTSDVMVTSRRTSIIANYQITRNADGKLNWLRVKSKKVQTNSEVQEVALAYSKPMTIEACFGSRQWNTPDGKQMSISTFRRRTEAAYDENLLDLITKGGGGKAAVYGPKRVEISKTYS